jgi:hypothetical protein
MIVTLAAARRELFAAAKGLPLPTDPYFCALAASVPKPPLVQQ